ncbi:MAG: C-GCAxxG-C-C family protein [Clostridia bacterium]|nr:C-GCAxxG-C-C family protein [Clostridia bacterium]
MNRKEKAVDLFTKGFNCCQAVVGAFEDQLSIDKSELMRIASSFGGGMGRLGEVCGAVTGMFIVFGLVHGFDTPDNSTVKKDHYGNIQALAHTFSAKHDSILCRELLSSNTESRHSCTQMVQDAVEILEHVITEKNQK